MAIIKGNYYGEDEPAQHAPRESNPEGTEGMLTAVIPTSVLKGVPFEVGDSVVLKIDSIQGDQLVVSYDEAGGAPVEEQEAPGNEAVPPEGTEGGMVSEVPVSDPMYD